MWFRKPSLIRPPATGKIELFARHCCYSAASSHKKRFAGFSREACFQNLLATMGSQVRATFLVDTALGVFEDHFLYSYRDDPVIPFQAGSEAKAFLFLLGHIASLPLDPHAIVYIVEDDYLHRQGWADVLREAFSLSIDYATLYDHRDKYFAPMYRKLASRVYATNSCHWRTTPSTTNTFAVRFETLKQDLSCHWRYSEGRSITEDHRKFCRLQAKGRILVSSIPGFSTHAEPLYASPCTDWETMIPLARKDVRGEK